jgi:hypothetical protein
LAAVVSNVNRLPERQCQERYDDIAELTRRGFSAPQIAAMLNVSTRLVQRARFARGMSRKVTSRPFTSEELAWAEAMVADGASFNEIARTLRRDVTVITARFKGRSSCTSADGARIRRMFQALEDLDWDQVRLKETG